MNNYLLKTVLDFNYEGRRMITGYAGMDSNEGWELLPFIYRFVIERNTI